MATIKGYWIKGKSRGKLRHWDGLLVEWAKNIERYMKFTDGEAPYWFKERANVSILAGAAWRSGWVALQGFEAMKQLPKGRHEKPWLGRCDLFIGSDERADMIEAKYKWLSLKSSNLVDDANKLLSSATKDAVDSKCRQDIDAVGVAFIPVYAQAKYVDSIDDLIHHALDQLGQADADACAWCFPHSMRTFLEEGWEYLDPGLILLARSAS